MRLPTRKPGKYTFPEFDPHITEDKFTELSKKLEKLKTHTRPQIIVEVKRLAEMGDFSENHAYSMAKGKLRAINQKILELENQLHHSTIIKPKKNKQFVELGNTITIESDGKQNVYTILGSPETNPQQGVISYKSPIGSSALGHKVGDKIKVQLNKNKELEYTIIKIE